MINSDKKLPVRGGCDIIYNMKYGTKNKIAQLLVTCLAGLLITPLAVLAVVLAKNYILIPFYAVTAVCAVVFLPYTIYFVYLLVGYEKNLKTAPVYKGTVTGCVCGALSSYAHEVEIECDGQKFLTPKVYRYRFAFEMRKQKVDFVVVKNRAYIIGLSYPDKAI